MQFFIALELKLAKSTGITVRLWGGEFPQRKNRIIN